MIKPNRTYTDPYCHPLPLNKARIVLLQAAQGTGKTRRIREALQGASAPVVSITHRQSLASKAAADFGIDNYLKLNGTLSSHHGSISIVANSLTKLNWRSFRDSVVVLDEFSQVLRHLKSRTVATNQIGVVNVLQALLTTAETVIAADADVDEASVRLLLQLARATLPDVWFERNAYAPGGRTVHMYDNEAQWLDTLAAHVQQGARVAVALELFLFSGQVRA